MPASSALASSLPISLAAVAVHSVAMLTVTAVLSLAVFAWFDLAVLRSTWINFDRLWTLALGATGVALLLQ